MNAKNVLFSLNWRLNRAPFWGYSILVWLLFFLFITLISALFLSSWNNTSMDTVTWPWLAISGILFLILYVIMIWINTAISVKRLHDLDKTWWMILLSFIPLINIYIAILLWFIKWTEWKNQYGEDPLWNNWANENITKSKENSTKQVEL